MHQLSNNFDNQFTARNRWQWRSCSGVVATAILFLNLFSLRAGPAVADGFSETNNRPAGPVSVMAATDATKAPVELDDVYKLGIGDRLSFKIVEDGEDSKPLQVTDSGDIDFPYIGRIPAVGETCKQLAADLKALLEKEYYYHATVVVAVDYKARSQGKVYLIGAVGAPGPQDIPSDEEFTLSKAILRAGGFTSFADQHHVRVTRKEPGRGASENKTFVVDVGAILSKGKTSLDLVLEAGDFIYIPEKMIRF